MEDAASAIREAEASILKAFMEVGDVQDATAMWAALSKSVDDSARIRIGELGGDAEEARAALDACFLLNPL